jgi:hypothetical protein
LYPPLKDFCLESKRHVQLRRCSLLHRSLKFFVLLLSQKLLPCLARLCRLAPEVLSEEALSVPLLPVPANPLLPLQKFKASYDSL